MILSIILYIFKKSNKCIIYNNIEIWQLSLSISYKHIRFNKTEIKYSEHMCKNIELFSKYRNTTMISCNSKNIFSSRIARSVRATITTDDDKIIGDTWRVR